MRLPRWLAPADDDKKDKDWHRPVLWCLLCTGGLLVRYGAPLWLAGAWAGVFVKLCIDWLW